MNAEGRTYKALRNTTFGLIYKAVDVILSFILRAVFIQTLSLSYLGVNGLFTNILTVLSLMEAGVGSAIVFSLYKPLAEQDYPKIASLMKLYRQVYRALGILISVAGFLLTPFLPFIINLPDTIPHIHVIYWLTIASTAVTYFLSYRRSLLLADQRADLNTKNLILFRITRFLLLGAVLLLTGNFILYLTADILNTIVSNLHITYVIRKRYKRVEETEAPPLAREEKREIVRYMSSGILAKVGQTVVNSTDNILISAFISTTLVGIYSNYNMIYMNLDVAIYLIFSGITASVGNYAVQKSPAESEQLYRKLFLINYFITCVVSVCALCLSTPFQLWLGAEYAFEDEVVIVLTLNFYITSLCNCAGNFLSSQGRLYYKNRFRALIEAVSNLVVSLLLTAVFDLGIIGVFLGTTACFVFGRMWMDSYTLYRHWFRAPYRSYVKMYLFRFGLFICLAGLCKEITGIVFRTLTVSVFSWLLCAVLCVAVSALALCLLYAGTEEFAYIKGLVSGILRKR